MTGDPLTILSSLATAASTALIALAVLRPPRRLRSRLAPYVSPSVAKPRSPLASGPAVFGPIVRDIADWLGRIIDRTGGEVSALRLRQSGWFRGIDEQQMVSDYRLMMLRAVAWSLLGALLLGQVIGATAQLRMALIGLSIVFAIGRQKGHLDRSIDSRREVMRIEIYTINQLLAMRVRAGGGVTQAVKSLTRRAGGEVASELEEALRLQRGGWAAPDAFRRIAELTPEPSCARTYRLLAAAEERGTDLARALLALADDVRESRRESIKRTATKRRAAMLVPTIAVLAPVLILFVAAPLPFLITGWQ